MKKLLLILAVTGAVTAACNDRHGDLAPKQAQQVIENADGSKTVIVPQQQQDNSLLWGLGGYLLGRSMGGGSTTHEIIREVPARTAPASTPQAAAEPKTTPPASSGNNSVGRASKSDSPPSTAPRGATSAPTRSYSSSAPTSSPSRSYSSGGSVRSGGRR